MTRAPLNLDQEAFASGLAANMSLENSYIAAGYKAKGASVYVLAKRLEIVERIQAINNEKATRINAEVINSRSRGAPLPKKALRLSSVASDLQT